MKLKPSILATLIGAFLWSGTAVQAHDLVIMPVENGQLRVRFGHPADWQSVDHEKLLELRTLDTAGHLTERHGELKRSGLDMVTPLKPRGALLTAARYDNGLWLKVPAPPGQPEQFRNASRFMVPEGTDGLLAVKFAKGIVLRRDDDTLYQKQLDHLLEIIPQKNPLSIARGGTLPVLVRFAGRPLADAGIEVSDMKTKIAEEKIVRYKTDANGIAQVRLRRGLNILAVDHTAPNDGTLGEAAKTLPVAKGALIATYTFRL